MKADSPASRTAPVLVPMPAEKPYSYSVPHGMKVVPGSIVRVPLGPREVAGIVWDGDGDEVDPHKLRPISQVFDCPPIDAPMRRLVDWISTYTLSPPGMVARMLLRAPEAFDPEPFVEGLQLTARTAAADDAGALARAGACGRWLCLDAFRPRPCGRRFARPSSTGCANAGVFEPVMIPPRPIVPAPDPGFAAARPGRRTSRRGSGADGQHRSGRIRRHVARRRHRFGQDRGLFRSGRRRDRQPASRC